MVNTLWVKTGNIIIRLWPQLDSKKAIKLKDNVTDSYATITGYYKKDNVWYKDTCRMHYIGATSSWWNNGKYKTMSTNVPEN